VQARVAGALERVQRARPENAFLPDERAIEVGRDDGDVAREVVGKPQARQPPLVLPWVEL
jgi:hypothetical protein